VRVQDLPISESAKSALSTSFGLDSLYPIQEEAIKAGVLEGEDVLLSAPTASGKTLVPLIVTLQEMERSPSKVVYMVPLRALAYEKLLEFKIASKLARPSGRNPRVGISTGDYDSPTEGLKFCDVIICTFEKMDSILRHRPSWLRDISTVVFDEIHLLHSADRGPVVEMLVASTGKLLPGAQKLALSATVSNDEEIASWMGCRLVRSEWRPVPLHEGIYYDNTISFSDKQEEVESKFGDEMMDLADHAMLDGGQILFFTPTRRQAVSLANKLAPVTSLSRHPSQVKELEKLANHMTQVEESSPVGTQLSSLVRKGVAFHHAGLPTSQRRLVEDGFRHGAIGTITATPTLAAGVNLPARYVCVTSVRRYSSSFGSHEISTMEYKQMAGRAGRPQFDKYGVALIRAGSERDAEILQENYIRAPVEPIRSMLGQSDFFSSATLSSVSSGIATSMNEVLSLFSNTLLARQRGTKYVDWRIKQKVRYLVDIGTVELDGDQIRATKLGRRVSELYILPETAASIIDRVARPPSDLTDVTVLHLVVSTPDMNPTLMTTQRDMEIVGDFLHEHAREFFPPDLESSDFSEAKMAGEAKTVMALRMWVEEASFDAIYERLGVEPGDLHVVNEKAAWLLYAASELTGFTGSKEVSAMAALMSKRVKFGIKRELLDLVSLTGIGRSRARNLFREGFKSRSDLAKASVEQLSLVPEIGSRLALSVKKQVGGLIKDKDLKSGSYEQRRLFRSG
jgi:helicase